MGRMACYIRHKPHGIGADETVERCIDVDITLGVVRMEGRLFAGKVMGHRGRRVDGKGQYWYMLWNKLKAIYKREI